MGDASHVSKKVGDAVPRVPALLHPCVEPTHRGAAANWGRSLISTIVFTAVLAMGLCLCVRLSVTSRCSIETDERIGLVFGVGASFDLSYTVL